MSPVRCAAGRVLPAVAVLLVAAGCSSLSSNGLNVGYPEAGANRAMLAVLTPLRIEIAPITDRRLDARRIGASPQDKKDIVTSRPVTEIVRDALVIELVKNGHAVAGSGADAILAVDVDEFWLDIVTSYGATHYVGKVAITLAVTNGRTGERVAARRYVGIRRRQVEADLQDARREVMDVALARTMHDLATDRALVAALAGLSGGSSSPRSARQ
jgi:Uncharacterized lipoprotein